jgi:hypothetical protein
MIWLVLLALAQPAPRVPEEISLDQMVAIPRPVVCTPDMTDFETHEAARGFLVSDCEFARIVQLRSDHRRLRLVLDAVLRLRTREFEIWRVADQQYRSAVMTLEQSVTAAEQRDWWERNALTVGVVLGVVGTMAVTFTAVQVVQ